MKDEAISAKVSEETRQALKPYVEQYGSESAAIRHLLAAGLRERYHVKTIFALSVSAGGLDVVRQVEPELLRAFNAAFREQFDRSDDVDWVEVARDAGVDLSARQVEALYKFERDDAGEEDAALVAGVIHQVIVNLTSGDVGDLSASPAELLEGIR